MFCKNCGTKINDNSKFCPRCGKPVGAPAAQPGQTQAADGGQSQWQDPNQPWQWENTGTQTPPQKPRRSKLKVIIPVVAGVTVVALGIGGFAFSRTNFFRSRFSSPSSYYRYVEARSIETAAKRLGNVLERSARMTSLDMNLSLGNAAMAMMGVAGYDEEDALAAISDLQIKTRTGQDGDLWGQEVLLYSGDTYLTSINMVTDHTDGETFVQFPELSSSYLSYSADEMQDMGMTPESLTGIYNMPDVGLMINLFNRYSSLILEFTDNVSREKDSVTVDGITQDALLLTVELDSRQMNDLAAAYVDTIKTDDEFREYMTWCFDLLGGYYSSYSYDGGYTSSEDLYEDFIDELESGLDASGGSMDGQGSLSMEVWVDSDGEVIGRSLSVTVDGETMELLHYLTVKDREAYAAEVVLGEPDDEYIGGIRILGQGTIDKDLADGVFYVESNGMEVCEIEVTDYDVAKAKEGYTDGTFAFSTQTEPELAGYGLQVTVASEDDSLGTSIAVLSNDVDMVTANITAGSDSYTPKLPGSETVYDAVDPLELEMYEEECDFDGFYDALSQNKFLEYYLSSLTSYGVD